MCCKVAELSLKNIVLHFKIKRRRLKLLKRYVAGLPEEIRRRERNFVCVKEKGFSFTIFPHSGNIVATGIRRRDLISRAVLAFIQMTDLPVYKRCLSALRVTNSTYTGKVQCDDITCGDVTMCQILSAAEDQQIQASKWDISFRSQFFPGIRIRHIAEGGTINLFNNGNFILVGVKSLEQAQRLRQELCVFMKMCWMTLNEATLCVWSAES